MLSANRMRPAMLSRILRRAATAASLALVAMAAANSPAIAQTTKAPPPPAAAPKAAEAKSGLKVVVAWARATPGGSKIGAAFLEIQGAPNADDKLIGASSPIAQAVELHDHIKDGGVMRMRRIESIAIPAGKTVTFKPGGLHLMLIDLKAPLVEGDAFDITLTFEKAGEIKVTAPVQKLGALKGPSGPAVDDGHGSGPGSGPGMKH